MAKFISYDNLSSFLSKLKDNFSNINHTHVSSNIDGLDNSLNSLQNNIDVLEQTVNDLSGNIQYNIVSITQDEYDALTTIDENTLYIIEV